MTTVTPCSRIWGWPISDRSTAMTSPPSRAPCDRAATLRRPVVVHCVTRKGNGYPPAEQDKTDHLHTVGVIDPRTGQPRSAGKPTWTSVFAQEIIAIGADRADVVCVTAAMLHPTGLGGFATRFPRPGVRRGDRRAARRHLRGGAGHRRVAPGGRALLHLRRAGLSTSCSWTSPCTS